MRNNRVALFDGIEEGGIRATSSYSHEIDEHDNERAMEGLQDRVNLLKRLSGDIHEEVDSHNRMLDRMGNDMDSSRGILSGTMDKLKMFLFLPVKRVDVFLCFAKSIVDVITMNSICLSGIRDQIKQENAFLSMNWLAVT
ncbi:hypothetical protein GOBAR_DD05427 [Gossypium barbadense]|nr:hypothetical protein GOBAR_DD05427 [Gossypium barbadense]